MSSEQVRKSILISVPGTLSIVWDANRLNFLETITMSLRWEWKKIFYFLIFRSFFSANNSKKNLQSIIDDSGLVFFLVANNFSRLKMRLFFLIVAKKFASNNQFSSIFIRITVKHTHTEERIIFSSTPILNHNDVSMAISEWIVSI